MSGRDDTRLPPAMRFRIRAWKTRLQVDRDFFTEAADLIDELMEALERCAECDPESAMFANAALAKARGDWPSPHLQGVDRMTDGGVYKRTDRNSPGRRLARRLGAEAAKRSRCATCYGKRYVTSGAWTDDRIRCPECNPYPEEAE